jgi:hypothetical protein
VGAAGPNVRVRGPNHRFRHLAHFPTAISAAPAPALETQRSVRAFAPTLDGDRPINNHLGVS